MEPTKDYLQFITKDRDRCTRDICWLGVRAGHRGGAARVKKVGLRKRETRIAISSDPTIVIATRIKGHTHESRIND